MTEQANTPERALAAVAAWNDAWLARDLEGMRRASSDDFIQWHVTIRKELSKAEEFAMLVDALKVMRIDFKDIRRIALDGGAVLQQCLADIEIEGGGTATDVPFAMIYETRGDQITRCDEYMDALSLPRLDFTPKG